MYNPKETEQEILKFWEEKKIFEKLKRKNKKGKPWSFIDGPITANNPMGVHHAWGRTYKDLYQRFKAMQGYQQRFQNGFDCQGLHVEVETEKDLGFNSKRDIENFGLANFSKKNRERVMKFAKIQTDQSIKLGQWMEWENSYYTMSDENIEAIWFFLKKCYANGWLYKGTKVLPWCCRCGTSLSQHELSDEGYAELTHDGIFIKCEIAGRKNEFLLVWTTTAWTLTANTALAINPSFTYAKVKQNNEIYYLSDKLLKILKGNYTIIEKIWGEKLVGLEYKSPYEELPSQKNVRHKVIGWKDVSEEEGTGIVHIAPGCGEEDYELGRKFKLRAISPLDEYGNYTKDFGWLTGRNVKEITKEIIADLRKKNMLYKVESYKHRYPICWRCKEELVFRLVHEWFISCNEIREKMEKAALQVSWQPPHVSKLMRDWLENMGDWNISRKRYWGLPLMFYECSCGELTIIGSVKELREKAIDKKKVDKLPELHRPWIDEIKIRCKCGKEVKRIKEVGDCWLDAGIVPFSTLHYFDDKAYWRKWFPAELVIEMRAQVRLWFYSMLFMSVTLEGKTPYKNVLAYEEVRDEKNQPMHKSMGNVIWFDEAVEKIGADVMRWMYIIQNPAFPLPFGYTAAKDVTRHFIVIDNLANYIKLYCKKSKGKGKDIASKWILSKIESLKKEFTENLEKLRPNVAIKALKEFLLVDLSRRYGQIIRGELDKKEVRGTLAYCFIEALKLLAPVCPFITEKIWQELRKELKLKEESIHLCDWPIADKKKINKKLEEDFALTLEIIERGLAERAKAAIGLRWPLAKAIVKTDKTLSKELQEIIAKQLNVKKTILEKGKKGKLAVKLDTKLTPELEAEGFAREIARKIQTERKKAGLQKEDKIFLALQVSKKLEKKLLKQEKNLKKRVNAIKLFINKKQKYKNYTLVEIKKEKIGVNFEKREQQQKRKI